MSTTIDMTITRHPDETTLLGFAAGSLPEPLSAVVAAHSSMCVRCRDDLRAMEHIGAALLVSPPRLIVPLTEMPGLPREDAVSPVAVSVQSARDKLPSPIARKYGLAFDTLDWKRLAPGVWHHRLALSPGVEGDLRLLKIAPGNKMPDHGHGGAELTLVLDGAYADESGSFRRGDVQDVDEEIEHRPVADRDLGCICLIASERPARFKTLVGRLLQPWTGM